MSGPVLGARVILGSSLVEFYSNWGKIDNKRTNRKPGAAC